MKQKLQLFRVVLCSFCVDAPRAHQKWDADSTYIAPASWQVVKDYTILLTVYIYIWIKKEQKQV